LRHICIDCFVYFGLFSVQVDCKEQSYIPNVQTNFDSPLAVYGSSSLIPPTSVRYNLLVQAQNLAGSIVPLDRQTMHVAGKALTPLEQAELNGVLTLMFQSALVKGFDGNCQYGRYTKDAFMLLPKACINDLSHMLSPLSQLWLAEYYSIVQARAGPWMKEAVSDAFKTVNVDTIICNNEPSKISVDQKIIDKSIGRAAEILRDHAKHIMQNPVNELSKGRYTIKSDNILLSKQNKLDECVFSGNVGKQLLPSPNPRAFGVPLTFVVEIRLAKSIQENMDLLPTDAEQRVVSQLSTATVAYNNAFLYLEKAHFNSKINTQSGAYINAKRITTTTKSLQTTLMADLKKSINIRLETAFQRILNLHGKIQ
jgi:hypothetical protein